MRYLLAALALALALTACNVSFNTTPQQQLPEPSAGTQAQQQEALAAARQYLADIDHGHYDKTWESAGPALRDMTNRFMWTNTLKLARKALDPPPKRELEGFGFTPRIDVNLPEGDYVLVQFTGLRGQVRVTEKLTMQKHEGRWGIIGYFIHAATQTSVGT